MIELYHGSNVIVENPLVNVGRRDLDFGPGFYVTQIQDQAVRWARRVCVIRRATTPYLCRFTFDDQAARAEGVLKSLPNYDIEWLDFIVASRKGQMPWEPFDMIEGGVANDQVIDTVEDYYAGRITADQAIGQLKFAKPSHQLCISSQSLVDNYLHFQSYEVIK